MLRLVIARAAFWIDTTFGGSIFAALICAAVIIAILI